MSSPFLSIPPQQSEALPSEINLALVAVDVRTLFSSLFMGRFGGCSLMEAARSAADLLSFLL